MATLKENFGVTESTATLTDNLLAGDMKRVEKAIKIVSGTGALTRGTVMGIITASENYVPYSDAGVAGEAVARGILAEDTDAATGGEVATYMYVTGQFNRAALTGIDAAGEIDLEAINVYVTAIAV